VFAAAHELYHIWFNSRPEAIPSSILGDMDAQGNPLDVYELKANRFAAEFLVDENMLRQEMQIYAIQPKKVSAKDILNLAALFTVPFRTMVKRLHETDAISFDDRERWLSKSASSISQLRKRYSIPEPAADERIAVDNLVELSVLAYEQKKITYEKLQYLLSISNLESKDIGIAEPRPYTPPGDDVLDSIMEE
jgi:Zn-dependent peptidase ImmA (M78 family)